jgi:hypothetical protein
VDFVKEFLTEYEKAHIEGYESGWLQHQRNKARGSSWGSMIIYGRKIWSRGLGDQMNLRYERRDQRKYNLFKAKQMRIMRAKRKRSKEPFNPFKFLKR